jgi:hypothetical protein
VTEQPPEQKQSHYDRKTQELQLIGRRAASGEDSGLSNLTEALESLLEAQIRQTRVFAGRSTTANKLKLLCLAPRALNGGLQRSSRRHTGSSDVREQFVEKLVFTVSEAFPNILRRSEIDRATS